MNDVAKKYFEYADAKARLLFAEYNKKNKEYKDAEEEVRKYPYRGGMVSADYMKNVVKAKEYYNVKYANLEECKKEFQALYDELKMHGKELEKELIKANEADPKKLDHDTIYLLESGILTSGEYAKLYEKAAGNPTMQRIIKKHIDEAAGKLPANDTSAEAINLRVLATQAHGDNTIDNYNVVLDIMEKTIRNKSMCDYWDQLAAPIIAEYVDD